MTPEEKAEKVRAEIDREGLAPASAADAPRIVQIIAQAIREAVEAERSQGKEEESANEPA